MAQQQCPNCGCFMLTGGDAERCFPKKFGLTKRQRECLEFIKDYSNQHGKVPTLKQMSKKLGFSGSGDGVFRILDNLEARGHIRRNAYKHRDIEVL